MKKVLFVNGCIRGGQSRTLRLAQRLVSRIPDAEIEVLLLPALHLTPYDAKDIAERDALSAAGAFGAPFFALANQFKTADAVVLACPFWDMSVPSMVRNYLERLCVTGLTFHYGSDNYPVGDCRLTRFVYVTTRGGIVDNRDPVLADHASAYLLSLCKLLSAGRFDTLAAEGLDIVGNDAEALLRAAENQAEEMAQHFWD
ncbi:NAD(P)H-dependent oxidoreductase [Agathobaculum sp. Marseille-P7918]|uniref:NAD(P)H-dependent oxidoreductase n=1 Tax=Agathobaculum sp. Marseille-P7918 TaxID=2479843 RepID=UPI000F64068C|nr:NAD(P)H-dependent oxidoreductase [Agathobaculum sp. Marseille-P7918]